MSCNNSLDGWGRGAFLDFNIGPKCPDMLIITMSIIILLYFQYFLMVVVIFILEIVAGILAFIFRSEVRSFLPFYTAFKEREINSQGKKNENDDSGTWKMTVPSRNISIIGRSMITVCHIELCSH